MAEYIERQAAIDELNGQIEYCDKALGSFDISLKDEYAVKVERASLIAYKEQLEAIPAADVVPVVHGKWIHMGCGVFECDKCGKRISTNVYVREEASDRFKFCPNCGAKMVE